MLSTKVHNRISSYEDISDFKLLPKIPIIIRLNGKSFSNITSEIEKPFCLEFMEAMSSTLIKLSKEAEGCIFGYSFHDEILLLIRNDQTTDTNPWFDNKIQKLASVTSSMA